MVVGCLHIALAEDKSNYVPSTRSLEHLTDYLHLGNKKVYHTGVKTPIEIKPSHLVHVAQEFPVWKIHKYSGIQIKPVSTIPYIHVVESKPDKPKFILPIEHIQNLLGTTTEPETILTLRELASSEEGLKLMASYIKSEYPQSDISEADIFSTISQYKVKRPSPNHQIYGPHHPAQIFGPPLEKYGPPSRPTIKPSPPHQVYGSPRASVENIPPPPHQFYGQSTQPQPPILQPHHSLALKKFSPIQILKSTLPQSFFNLLTPKNEIPTHPSISQHNPPLPQRLGQSHDINYLQPQPLITYEPPQPPKWYRIPHSQPSKEYVPYQPQPPTEYGPPKPEPIKEYGVPQTQPPKMFAQYQPRPPKEYGPPQPPKEYGPLQPQPPKVYIQYQPQPQKEYRPLQPQPLKEYGIPQLQSSKVYVQNKPLPPREYGPPQPTKLNDKESNLGEVYNIPKTKDSSFIVKAEPIVVIDSQNTADITKGIAFISAYGLPPTEPPSIEEVDSQDDKVENVINSEKEQEDSNFKVETPKESYGPPKPYAPPDELPKHSVPEKIDELGERSENEQNEYLTIPQENSDATSEFLPQSKEPEDKYGPPLIVYGKPKPYTMGKEDSEDLQSNENGEILIPPQESNDSSSEFRPQQPSNEPAQTYGPPQSFYVIPKPYSTDKKYAEEIQSNIHNVVLNSPEVSSDSSSDYHPFEEYGVPVETSPSKPVFESEKPVYANSYPGYEPTTVGTSEAQKIHSTSSSQNIPDVIPMSMAASGLKWSDFETGIHSLNDDNDAIQPDKLITNVLDGSSKLHLPSVKYQSQQSSFVPTYEPNKYMMAVQQDFYSTNIKPVSLGDVKVTQNKINTNGRDVTALKYDHPNFSYTQLSKVPSDVIPSPPYTRISEIPLENNVNFQNVPDQVSSYGQPLSSYIFGEESLPAASEKKISAVVPEYRKKSEIGIKSSQDKTPEGITKGRNPVVKINRDKLTRRRWMPMSKRKEESQGSE